MLAETTFRTGNIELFKQQALQLAYTFNIACYLDSNHYEDSYSAFDVLIGFGKRGSVISSAGRAFTDLQTFLSKHRVWALGFLSYDLKNELEVLSSGNPDYLGFPDLFFFVPQHLILIRNDEIRISSPDPRALFEAINKLDLAAATAHIPLSIHSRLSKSDYLEKVRNLKIHIQRGDIYEVNFCQEFYCQEADIDPLSVFHSLNAVSPTPFASFFKLDDKFILCASPERFLCKRGSKLISQPIKGTAKRSANPEQDLENKRSLLSDPKEQAENVMIVDLVRNDLTRSAIPGTVRVEELFGIYSFRQVHQMISTVICQANPQLGISEVISNTFPMGSMTGAPKLRAMQLIEEFERTKRGVYSGAVGYFAPTGDFDFNVVIRSILYDRAARYLSFQTGSAITGDSDPEKEYDECLLKAKAMLEVLN